MAPARRLLALAAAAIATGSHGLETPQWPPPPETLERMRALQQSIRDPAATPAQREAAREELSGLLKSPAGQSRGRTAGEKPPRPARAAIDPFPGVVRPTQIRPAPGATVPAEGVARLEVIEPPKPVPIPAKPAVDPRTGATLLRSPRTAVDPLTGSVLHEVPGGYVDPRTGQFVPR